jgi:UDP-glucuronate 4-epimerase
MAHSYSALYKLPTTGLRFFTVYGPWGRPDMAFFKFTNKIIKGESVDVYNHGHHARDFTYIDDIVEGVKRVSLGEPPKENLTWNSKEPNASTSSAPYRVFNIGNSRAEALMRYIEVLENCIGKKAEKNFLPMQSGDVAETHADVSELAHEYDYRPNTPIEVGLKNFVEWYRSYYKI